MQRAFLRASSFYLAFSRHGNSPVARNSSGLPVAVTAEPGHEDLKQGVQRFGATAKCSLSQRN